MAEQVPDKYADLFKKKAFANLATLMKDGSPQVTPVWCDYDGKNVRVNSALGRVKDKNIRRDPRVSLAIQDPENPYRYMEIRGKVVEITQNVAKISGQSRLSLSPARRSTRALQDRAGKSQLDGVGAE
jgi:PPOX class probable F420-dependent enzyme